MGTNRVLINDVIRTLSKHDKEMLRYAHTYNSPAYVKLPGNRFIGVHCNGMRQLIIEDTYNDWSIGLIQYHELPNGSPDGESK